MPAPAAGRQQCCHGGHDDGTETQQAGLEMAYLRAFVFVAFGFEREVDHHDGVLFHNTDEQDDTNDGDDAQIGTAEQYARSAPTPADGSVERMVIG